jgi:ABC-type multidrug transport system fused ATPase/permease subunit
LSKTRVVIVIAHRLSTIREADLIIFLDNGVLRERGNHSQLMSLRNGLYRRFFEQHRV